MPQIKPIKSSLSKGRRRVLVAGLGLLLLLVAVVRLAGPQIGLTWLAGFQYRLVYLLTPCCGELRHYEDENISFSWREACDEDGSGGGAYSGFISRFGNDILWLDYGSEKNIEAGGIGIARYENSAKAFDPKGGGNYKTLDSWRAEAPRRSGPDTGSIKDILEAVDPRVSGRIKILKTPAGEIAVVDNVEDDMVCFHDAAKRLYCFNGTASPRAGEDYSILGRLYFELTGSGSTTAGPFQIGVIDWLKTPALDKRTVCRTETIIKTLRIKGR